MRQPAHTILFDIGRNFLQSFFLPVSALLAPQRLLLRLCGLSSRTSLPSTSNNKWTPSSESNTFSTAGTSSTFRVLFENSVPSPATSGRLIPGRTLLLHRKDFLFHFSGFCSKTQSITINKRTPFSGLNTTSPLQATSSSAFRVLFEAQHHFSHPQRLLLPLSGFCSQAHSHHHHQQVDDFFGVEHLISLASDFFFHFPGFVRKLGSITSIKDSQAPTKMAFYNTPEPSSPITGPNDFDSVYLPSGPGQDGDGDKPIPGGQDLTTATEIPGINTCMEVVVHAQAASLPLTEAQGALAPKKERELRSGPNHGGGDCLTRATRARRGIIACVALPRWGRCGVACSRPSFYFRSLFRRLRRRSRGGHVAPFFHTNTGHVSRHWRLFR